MFHGFADEMEGAGDDDAVVVFGFGDGVCEGGARFDGNVWSDGAELVGDELGVGGAVAVDGDGENATGDGREFAGHAGDVFVGEDADDEGRFYARKIFLKSLPECLGTGGIVRAVENVAAANIKTARPVHVAALFGESVWERE